MSEEESTVTGLLTKFTSHTDDVWKYLVCPKRYGYAEDSLGPTFQTHGEIDYERINDNFVNKRGDTVEFSFFRCDDKQKPKQVIIYLHSHGGTRLEGMDILEHAHKSLFDLCQIDFAGAGKSTGEFISLGYFEKDDTAQLMKIQKENYGCLSSILWGRSMGAATVMLTLAEPNLKLPVNLIVLDAPFMDLKKVYQKCIKKVVSLPNFLINMIYSYAKKKIKKNCGFDVGKVRPVNCINSIKVPAVLMGSKNDEQVEYSDMKKLNRTLKNIRTKFVKTEGCHNEDRTDEEMLEVFEFIRNELSEPKNYDPNLLEAVKRHSMRENMYNLNPGKPDQRNGKSEKFIMGSNNKNYGNIPHGGSKNDKKLKLLNKINQQNSDHKGTNDDFSLANKLAVKSVDARKMKSLLKFGDKNANPLMGNGLNYRRASEANVAKSKKETFPGFEVFNTSVDKCLPKNSSFSDLGNTRKNNLFNNKQRNVSVTAARDNSNQNDKSSMYLSNKRFNTLHENEKYNAPEVLNTTFDGFNKNDKSKKNSHNDKVAKSSHYSTDQRFSQINSQDVTMATEDNSDRHKASLFKVGQNTPNNNNKNSNILQRLVHDAANVNMNNEKVKNFHNSYNNINPSNPVNYRKDSTSTNFSKNPPQNMYKKDYAKEHVDLDNSKGYQNYQISPMLSTNVNVLQYADRMDTNRKNLLMETKEISGKQIDASKSNFNPLQGDVFKINNDKSLQNTPKPQLKLGMNQEQQNLRESDKNRTNNVYETTPWQNSAEKEGFHARRGSQSSQNNVVYYLQNNNSKNVTSRNVVNGSSVNNKNANLESNSFSHGNVQLDNNAYQFIDIQNKNIFNHSNGKSGYQNDNYNKNSDYTKYPITNGQIAVQVNQSNQNADQKNVKSLKRISTNSSNIQNQPNYDIYSKQKVDNNTGFSNLNSLSPTTQREKAKTISYNPSNNDKRRQNRARGNIKEDFGSQNYSKNEALNQYNNNQRVQGYPNYNKEKEYLENVPVKSNMNPLKGKISSSDYEISMQKQISSNSYQNYKNGPQKSTTAYSHMTVINDKPSNKMLVNSNMVTKPPDSTFVRNSVSSKMGQNNNTSMNPLQNGMNGVEIRDSRSNTYYAKGSVSNNYYVNDNLNQNRKRINSDLIRDQYR